MTLDTYFVNLTNYISNFGYCHLCLKLIDQAAMGWLSRSLQTILFATEMSYTDNGVDIFSVLHSNQPTFHHKNSDTVI